MFQLSAGISVGAGFQGQPAAQRGDVSLLANGFLGHLHDVEEMHVPLEGDPRLPR